MKLLLASIIIFVFSSGVTGQTERLSGMGNLQYTIPDLNYGLNPYDFGGNPAWLVRDELESWLKIIPSMGTANGTYRRRYDAAEEGKYLLKFRGIKTLEEDGTFGGETSYEYNLRRGVPRSLKHHTYSGEAFFFTDTTTGDFRYNGPQIKFSYSFEPFKDLYAGASVDYRVLDGLKSVYSRAEVLFMEIEENVGLAYGITDNMVIGINYIHLNNKEKIESKSEDLLDVEVYNYKGETYAIKKRAQSVNQKITGNGNKISGQFYYHPSDRTELSIVGSISNLGQQILMPYSVSGQSFAEYEEGYTSFNEQSLRLVSRFGLTEKIIFGVSAGYGRSYVWSNNTPKDKLLWETEIKTLSGGFGASWKPAESFIIGAEYEYVNLGADSSKYIDTRFSNIVSGNHSLRIGAEYRLNPELSIRGGYNLSLLEYDIVYGGENVGINNVTMGLGIYVFPSVPIDIQVEYGFYNNLPGSLERSQFSGFATVKLYSF